VGYVKWKTIVGKPTAFLQTGGSQKVHILGLQPMRQENDIVYTYRLLSIKMQIFRSSQYKDVYVRWLWSYSVVRLAACRDGVWGMEAQFHCFYYMGASV